MRLIPLALALALTAIAAPAAAQQNLFAPRLLIDGQAISNYEYQQRRLFMQLLGAPGDLDRETENALIEDRLRMAEARRLGIELTDEQLLAGMEEFASRVELTAEEFVAALEENGVAAETFRDFVRAGLVWRDVAAARFGPYAGSVTEAEVDRALSIAAQRGTLRVLLGEIVLPPEEEELAEQLAASLRGEGAFAAAAAQHSVAASAAQGGRLDWVPAANLHPSVVAALAPLGAGQVTPAIRLPEGWAIYQLRNIEEREEVTPQLTSVEYAQYLIPGAGSAEAEAEAARIRARVDVCGDLYGVARGEPEERLQFTRTLLPAVPAEIAAELERLDEGEASTRLTRGGATVFLMLCARRVASDLPPSREAVRERLMNERIGGMAGIHLEELRANANIRYP